MGTTRNASPETDPITMRQCSAAECFCRHPPKREVMSTGEVYTVVEVRTFRRLAWMIVGRDVRWYMYSYREGRA